MFILKRWFGWIPWKAWIVLVVATLLGVGLSIGVFFAIRVQEKQMNKMMFYNAADNAALYISTQMNQLTSMLEDTANFFSYNSRLPTYAEFKGFVQPLMDSSPAVVAIEYAPYFPQTTRAQWVSANTMVSNYTLMVFSITSGSLEPEDNSHSNYLPVYYIVPFIPGRENEIMIGLDLETFPARSQLMNVVSNDQIVVFPTPYYEAGILSGYGVAVGVPVLNGTGGTPVGLIVGLLSLDFIAMAAYMEQMTIMSATGSMSTGSYQYTIFQDNGLNPSGNGQESYQFLFYSNGNMDDMSQLMMGMNTTGMMSGMTMTMTSSSTGSGATTGATTGTMTGMHMTEAISTGSSPNWPYNFNSPKYTDPSQIHGPLIRKEMIEFNGVKWLMVCVNDDSWGTWVPWTMMGIVLALTVLLVGYLVFSVWGYKKAFDAANESSTNGDSSGMFKAKDTAHTNGDATKDDNID